MEFLTIAAERPELHCYLSTSPLHHYRTFMDVVLRVWSLHCVDEIIAAVLGDINDIHG